jgi:hypothetical protein
MPDAWFPGLARRGVRRNMESPLYGAYLRARVTTVILDELSIPLASHVGFRL